MTYMSITKNRDSITYYDDTGAYLQTHTNSFKYSNWWQLSLQDGYFVLRNVFKVKFLNNGIEIIYHGATIKNLPLLHLKFTKGGRNYGRFYFYLEGTTWQITIENIKKDFTQEPHVSVFIEELEEED